MGADTGEYANIGVMVVGRLVSCRAFVLLVLCGAFSPAAGQEATPFTVVERFQSGLLQTMKDGAALDLRGRYLLFKPIVEETFAMPLMLRRVAGGYWTSATSEQKLSLVRAFHRMSASTLATFFDGYDGEQFRVLGQRAGPGKGQVYVDTHIVLTDGSPVKISYLAVHVGARWWLIDVIVNDGISELRVRRSEYRRALDANGIENLTAVLSRKADDLVGPG